jgi:hypothetical protein
MSNLETIKSFQDSYVPGPHVETHLSWRSGVVIVGPMAVGKTTLLDYVPDRDNDFGAATSFTTRKERPSDTSRNSTNLYRYLPADEATYADILEKIMDGSLVHFAVHPSTDAVYGSELGDYSSEYMLLDRVYSSVNKAVDLPFDNISIATILAEPDNWKRMFGYRSREIIIEEKARRLEEGCQSLEWSLNQEQMNWIMNPERRVTKAVDEVIKLGRFGYTSDIAGPSDAEALLATIAETRRKL